MIRSESQQVAPAACPAWVRQAPALTGESHAAFAAGAALALLDARIRLASSSSGVWRQRLSLRAAAATIRRQGRREEELELRDAWLLRRAADDWGPAGRVLRAWRSLAGRSTTLSKEQLHGAYEDICGRARELDPALVRIVEETLASPQTPVAAAADVIARVYRIDPAAELFALWLADLIVAHKLRWPFPLPLLASAIAHPTLRQGRAPKPGEQGSEQLVARAYATAAIGAIDLAADVDRRALKLTSVAPKLRAKDAGLVVTALLDDDAIAPNGRFGRLSDRSMRRLCDRLVDLGAVRELTGRQTSRLYGL